MYIGIAFSLNALYLIKWEDGTGNSHNFYLAANTSKQWRKIGHELKYTEEELDAIKQEHDTHELCWSSVMEKWYTSGSLSYPASWDSLYSILVNIDESDIAKRLKRAVTRAIPPPSTFKVKNSCPGNYLA